MSLSSPRCCLACENAVRPRNYVRLSGSQSPIQAESLEKYIAHPKRKFPPEYFRSALFVEEAEYWRGATSGATSPRWKDRNGVANDPRRHKYNESPNPPARNRDGQVGKNHGAYTQTPPKHTHTVKQECGGGYARGATLAQSAASSASSAGD